MVNLIVAVVVEPLPALFFDFFLGFALAGGDVFWWIFGESPAVLLVETDSESV